MRHILILLISLSSIASADQGTSIRERLKWADDKKCTISFDGKIRPYIPFLASIYLDERTDNTKVKEKIISAADRGCDVNSTDQDGFSALNVGVLHNEPEIVRLMLNLGANPKLIIQTDSKYFSGLNSLEFTQLLSKIKGSREEIELLLK